MEYQLKSKEYYYGLKEIMNKYNLKVKKYMGKPFIGDCSYFFSTYFDGSSYEDYFFKYISNADENFNHVTGKGNEFKGRSIDQLRRIAEIECEDIDNPAITVDMCMDDLITHAIFETVDGHLSEIEFERQYLNKDEYDIERTYGDLDSRCGVDIIATRKLDGVKYFFQIKPISFFKGNRNLSLKNDRKEFLFVKQNNLISIMRERGYDGDCTILFIIYENKDGNIIFHKNARNGKYCWCLSELIDNNGEVKNYKTKI